MKAITPFVLSALGLLVAGYCYLWARSAAPLSFTECSGVFSLLSQDPQCQWPAAAHYGFKVGLLLCLGLLFAGLRMRKQRG